MAKKQYKYRLLSVNLGPRPEWSENDRAYIEWWINQQGTEGFQFKGIVRFSESMIYVVMEKGRGKEATCNNLFGMDWETLLAECDDPDFRHRRNPAPGIG